MDKSKLWDFFSTCVKLDAAQPTNISKVNNLLAQHDSRLNLTIAEATKRDSSAMKTIAIVTMLFLPGAYIAVSLHLHTVGVALWYVSSALFSMNMFNWQGRGDGDVVLRYFWVYWAVTVPVTVVVIGV